MMLRSEEGRGWRGCGRVLFRSGGAADPEAVVLVRGRAAVERAGRVEDAAADQRGQHRHDVVVLQLPPRVVGAVDTGHDGTREAAAERRAPVARRIAAEEAD